jgi:hypothetical protein
VGGSFHLQQEKNKMKTTRLKTFLVSALLLSGAELALEAQNYSIDWYKVSGGGGTSTGGIYSLSGTIGQHDAGGPMSGESYSLTGGFWALYAIQTPGAPTLFITKSGTNAVLYWSASAGAYGLVSKNDLASPVSWSAVSPGPVTVNGFNYVTNAIAPGNNFYRLRAQ